MRTFRASLLVPALTILGLLLAASAGAVVAPAGQPAQPFLGHYDVRVMGGAEAPRLAVATAAAGLDGAMRQAAARLEVTVPGVKVERSPIGGGVEVVGGAPLTVPAPGKDARSIVLGFLRANAGVYGLSAEQVENLEFLGESDGPGARTINLRQTIRGLPVFQSDTRAILDAEGRLLRTVGRLVPGIDEARVSEEFALGSDEALGAALQTVGLQLDATEVTRRARSERMYFPLGPGMVVPAWTHVTLTRGDSDWYTVVDARTGVLLWRKDIRYHWKRKPRKAAEEACFEVWAQSDGVPLASPAPGLPSDSCSQAKRVENRNLIKSPASWFTTTNGNRTTDGAFAKVYLDLDANDVNDGLPGPEIPTVATGAACVPYLDYSPPPRDLDDSECPDPETGEIPLDDESREGSLIHLFYLVNWFHDELAKLGFIETMGNFQNRDEPNKPDDPILAEAQYGADVGIYNLASFTAPPDGTPGILRLSLWNGPDLDRDASLDAEVVFHELMHGVTSRLIGNGAGLNWFPGRALAEGWSDFFALALLDPEGNASEGAIGRYTAYRLGGHDFKDNYIYGMRRFPYSEDPPRNPLTWADVDDTTDCFGEATPCTGQSELHWERFGANEIHNAGELWALTLWEARTAALTGLTSAQKKDTAKDFLAIVFKGLVSLPNDPSILQARDALLTACRDAGCDFETAISAAFANSELGTPACDSGGIATHYGIGTTASCDTIKPTVLPLKDPITFTCTYVAPTWLATIKRKDGTPVPATDASATCDSLPAGRGAEIPDGDLLGQSFTMKIDLAPGSHSFINDIKLQINELTHPWVGDLTVMLKGPNGYGSDLIYRLANDPGDKEPDINAPTPCDRVLAFRVPGMNRGDNLTSTVIFDNAPNDLLTAGCNRKPYSGSWKPTLQSSVWLAPFAKDKGPLSHFRGIDLNDGNPGVPEKRTWTLFVSDVVPGGDDPDKGGDQPGSLTSWSLVITPQ